MSCTGLKREKEETRTKQHIGRACQLQPRGLNQRGTPLPRSLISISASPMGNTLGAGGSTPEYPAIRCHNTLAPGTGLSAGFPGLNPWTLCVPASTSIALLTSRPGTNSDVSDKLRLFHLIRFFEFLFRQQRKKIMQDSPFVLDRSKWIWTPGFDDAAAKGQFVLFRRAFELDHEPLSEVILHVSADTRYRLYLNGQSIGFGPAKSYLSRWYYDTFDITAHLKQGPNVLAARVLRFSSTHDGCLSMIRSPFPGLLLSCEVGVSLFVHSRLPSCLSH